MGGASSFYAMLAICGFLTAAWTATKVSKLIGISSIVLEIATGVILGPQVLGLINEEYAQCEHQRHADCVAPADLYNRIHDGRPLGEALGRIANMDYCDLHAYLEKEGRSGSGVGHTGVLGHVGGSSEPGTGHVDGTSHRDPCGDGAHLPGFYTWNVTLGNGSVARYHCRNGTLLTEELLTATSSRPPGVYDQGVDVPTTTQATAAPTTAAAPATTAASGTVAPVPALPVTAAPLTTTTAPAAATTGPPASTSVAAAQATTAADLEEPLNDTDDDAEANATESDESDSSLVAAAGTSAPLRAVAGTRRLSGGGGGGGTKYETYQQCLEKSCEADVSHRCGLTPDVFTLIGHAGVALMIFESGMHFDFEKARQVGVPACIVAVIGTILPLVSGSLLVVAYGKPFSPDGISAGTALAPTSVGISLRLLGEAGVLQESFGQAIITAAFVDDILSLVLFNVLFSLGGEFNAITTIVFPIIGIVFMIGCMIAAVKFWPLVIDEKLMPMIPDERDDLATGLGRIRLTKDEVLFLIMIFLLVAYALITHLLGTHLWGCFMAGMSFACLQPAGHAHHVWVKQTKRMTTWMIRIFFACTVAFSIPVADLMSFNAFWKGSIMGVGPCIFTKVVCALFMGPPKFVIGWAMVGRAEFAYLIAQMASAANMIDEETFSICIWALLYATIFAPFIFRWLLDRYVKEYGLTGKGADAEAPQEACGGEGEESGAPKKDFARADAGADAGLADRLRDLDGIKLSPAEDNLKGGGNGNAPGLEVMGDSSPGEDSSDADVLPAKSALKPRGGVRVPKDQQGGGIWSGSGSRSNGFLCCLFFKRIVEH